MLFPDTTDHFDQWMELERISSTERKNSLVLFEITIILCVTVFFFFLEIEENFSSNVIFDESQNAERVRTIGLDKSFEIVEMDELFLQYFEIDDLGMCC